MLTSAQAFLDYFVGFISKSEEEEFTGNPKTKVGVFEVKMREGVSLPTVTLTQLAGLQRDFFRSGPFASDERKKSSGQFQLSATNKSALGHLFDGRSLPVAQSRAPGWSSVQVRKTTFEWTQSEAFAANGEELLDAVLVPLKSTSV